MKPGTSEEMRNRAQRHLDGMTVNKDEMAKDVIYLCEVVNRLSQRIADGKSTSKNGFSIDDLANLFGGGFK